jgi:hypothetical protein
MDTALYYIYNTIKGNRNHPQPCTKTGNLYIFMVQRTIHELYLHEKELPTITAVLPKLQQSIGYKEENICLKDLNR